MKLSIVTTTYNSESFVGDTIKAVLDQEFTFNVEYLISDDGSTDRTVEIIEEIRDRHPNGSCIRLLAHEQNQGVMKNFFGAVLQTQGQYIAFCDSDDVWSDLKKLAKQIAYMEENENCMMTYHGYKNIVDENLPGTLLRHFDEPVNRVINKPQTSTMMVDGILRSLIDINVVNEAQGPQNDQYLRLLLQNKGDFKILDNIEPNVRIVRESSIFSTVNKLTKKKKSLHSWQTFYKYHGHGSNQEYLARKVKGFNSTVKWLEFQEEKKLKLLWNALTFDLGNGISIRKIFNKGKKILLRPLLYLKQLSTKNQ